MPIAVRKARAVAEGFLAEQHPSHRLAPGAYADDTAAVFDHYEPTVGEPAFGEGPVWVDLVTGDVELLGSTERRERIAAMRRVR